MPRKLKFGSPAWRKKYLRKKRPATKKRARNPRARRYYQTDYKTGISGWVTRPRTDKMERAAAAARRRRAAKKTNPPKLKPLKKSTGWMKASAVKIVKKGGQMQVLVRKPGRRKAR